MFCCPECSFPPGMLLACAGDAISPVSDGRFRISLSFLLQASLQVSAYTYDPIMSAPSPIILHHCRPGRRPSSRTRISGTPGCLSTDRFRPSLRCFSAIYAPHGSAVESSDAAPKDFGYLLFFPLAHHLSGNLDLFVPTSEGRPICIRFLSPPGDFLPTLTFIFLAT